MRALAGHALVVAVVAIITISGCNRDRFGAYIHVTSNDPIDQVEFVFGGLFPSPDCDGSADNVPALRATPAFTAPSPGDTMFRRQPSPGDLRRVDGTEYTLYVDTPVNDPDFGFPDELGHALIVIGTTAGGDLRVGELADFEVPGDAVNKYDVPLVATDTTQVEEWGANERCVRYTRKLASGATASEYIVPTWDRDCDGFVTQLCGQAVDDDCDPLAFCDSSNPGDPNCAVPDGCSSPGPSNSTCALSACVNVGNNPTKVCDAPRGFCLENAKCSIKNCERPPLECLATRQNPDVHCTVPVQRVDLPEGTVQVACNGVLPGILHEGPPDDVCTIVVQTPLDPRHHASVTFRTPTDGGGGCNLAMDPPVSTGATLPEMRLIVEVESVVETPGTLIVAIDPEEVDNCDNPPAIKCDDSTAELETCME